MSLSKQQIQTLYYAGRKARHEGSGLDECDILDPVRRTWWLAGWHDLDMEKGNARYFRDYKEAA